MSDKIRQVSPILPPISHSLCHYLLISHTSWVIHWLSGFVRSHFHRSGNARHSPFTHSTYYSKFLSISIFFHSFIQPTTVSLFPLHSNLLSFLPLFTHTLPNHKINLSKQTGGAESQHRTPSLPAHSEHCAFFYFLTFFRISFFFHKKRFQK